MKPAESVIQQINLYYLQDNNTIDQLTTSDYLTWHRPSNLPDSSTRLADPDSKLAATYQGTAGCSGCPNSTVLIYQYLSQIVVANASMTSGDWVTQNLSSLDASPAAGTALSAFYQSIENEGGLRVWFENDERQLCFFAFDESTGWVNRGELLLSTAYSRPFLLQRLYERGNPTTLLLTRFQRRPRPHPHLLLPDHLPLLRQPHQRQFRNLPNPLLHRLHRRQPQHLRLEIRTLVTELVDRRLQPFDALEFLE